MTPLRIRALPCLLAACLLTSETSAVDRPNVVYILADDLGYGDLSCFGQTTLRTPRIDRMAREGMRFTQHYAGSTVCAPSRCVLLTGKHIGHARIRSNRPGLLDDADITVAEVLKKAGYRTGCFGKWGVGHPPPPGDPERNGFDEFYGYLSMWHAHNFYPEFVYRNASRETLKNKSATRWRDNPKAIDGRGVAVERIDYVPDLVTREALAFMERHRSREFFLYLALNVPHANNEAGDKGMEVPSHREFAEREWPEPEKGFAAMLANIDRDVGLVLDKIRELKIDEKTLVIFTSDNGPHQEGGHRMEFFDSNGPLRGFKRDLYEGGIRVPMIARWPGKVRAGSKSAHLSGFQDMLATFAELAATSPPKTDGISMVPTLLGRDAEQKQHEYLYWEFRQAHWRAARLGRWKAVLQPPRDQQGTIELYDLSKDLGEKNDIAGHHPDVVERMKRIFDAAHEEP